MLTDTDPLPSDDRPPRYSQRALPPYRYLTGSARPHPVRGGYLGEPDEDSAVAVPDPGQWHTCPIYLYGADLFNLAYWWEAHEAWEDLWKRTDDPVQRDFLQGLILVSAAQLKHHLEQPRGADRLIARALRRTRQACEALGGAAVYMGVDLADWQRRLETARQAWRAGRPATIVLHLRMRTGEDESGRAG